MRQAEDNIRAATLKLSTGEVKSLDDAAAARRLPRDGRAALRQPLADFFHPKLGEDTECVRSSDCEDASPFKNLSQSLDTKQAMYEA